MAKKRGAAHGGHGWFVTFADLMGLMMSFFVMLVAFSTQDKEKLKIVAGSMRDAFGVQQVRYNGLVETDGLPTRPAVKNAARINPEDASATPGPSEQDRYKEGLRLKDDKSFALAAASLRQAMQEMPEISAERANAVRQILEDEGLPGSHMFMVGAKADSQPLFPDDPHIAANRRVTITLMREAPPLPVGFKP